MATFLLRRLGLMVLTLWLLTLIVFFAGQILPGDPARATLGNLAAPSAVKALDHQLGVDRPLLDRYGSWLGGLLHGNLGTSYAYQSAVEPFIRAALINSIKLAALAFVIVVPLGILGGVIAALYCGGRRTGSSRSPDFRCPRCPSSCPASCSSWCSASS